ncbi:hypothetical protein AURDEDRAFT_168863 [Auricularia subglabra TFB-10046 SS5]|nr:hypothetical protein AURDEDRAFT_168863 [Auricularia subglabra TFB-10046 SS5]
MPPTHDQSTPPAGPRPAIKSRDWHIIRLLLEDEPRKTAAGIYNQLRQRWHPAIPTDFYTSPQWEGISSLLRIAAAIGDGEPTAQQSENLLDVVDNAANEFEEALEATSAGKRKTGATSDSGPTPKRQKTLDVKRVYDSWSEIEDKLTRLLALIQSDIADWLSAEHHLPLWEPSQGSSWHQPEYRAALDHIRSLCLPRTPASASGACLADTLLYKLGESDDLDPDFAEKKRKVKTGNAHRVIANVSGSGKTRMTLEVLSEEWSFYFMADYDPIVNPYGSQDVKFALLDLEHSTDSAGRSFVPRISQRGRGDMSVTETGAKQGAANAKMADQVFSAVVLARILVHNQFLIAYDQLASASKEKLHGPKLWLLLQVLPVLNGRDVFLEVYRALKSLARNDLETKIYGYLDRWSSSGHSIARIAIDEVQHLVATYPHAFVGTPDSVGGSIPTRPVFKPLVATLSSFFLASDSREARFLLSGTQLCVADAFRAVVSTAVKNATVVESSVTAAHFDVLPGTSNFDPTPIIRYLSHFLTAGIVTGFGSLLRDIIFWLRGRPRFLAYFVQWGLQTGPDAARQVLINIVSKLTAVELSVCAGPGAPIADIVEMQLRPLLSTALTDAILWDKEKNSRSESCHTIVRAMLNLLIEGRYTRITSHHQQLVELGIGKFEESTESCWIRENLVLARLFAYFSTPDGDATFIGTINERLEHPQRSVGGFAFENALIWLFWRLFTTSTPTLDSFLTFFGSDSGTVPPWATRRAKLVHYFDGDKFIPVSSSSFAVGLAATGAKPSDTLSWLQNETRLPFFKPDENLGPDFCCRVAVEREVPGTYDILLICVQGKFGESKFSEANFRKAVSTVSPDHFYNVKQKSSRTAILGALPVWETVGMMPISHVLDQQDDSDAASYPGDSASEWSGDGEPVRSYDTVGDYAVVGVLATTKLVKKWIDTTEGPGKYALAYMPLITFEHAVTNFQLSGLRPALESAYTSLAASYASGSNGSSTRSRKPA